MTIQDIENSIINAVKEAFGSEESDGIDFFKLVTVGRKIEDKNGAADTEKIVFPMFSLESPEDVPELFSGADLNITIKMVAYVICKKSDTENLLALLLDIVKFLRESNLEDITSIENVAVMPVTFSDLPNTYAKMLTFDVITEI